MTAIAKWSLSSVGLTTVMSTELNTLSNTSMSSSSSAFANDTNLDILVDIEVFLASFTPVTPASVNLFLIESVDGTNYADPSGAAAAHTLLVTSSHRLATIPVGGTAATEQRVVFRKAVIPPGKFKLVMENQTGANLAASGNTVKFLPYNLNLNG